MPNNKLMNLVRDAVDDLDNGQGVSRQKIVDYAMKTGKRTGKNVANSIKMAIVKALNSGIIERTSGSGLKGSFRLLESPSDCELISVATRNELQLNYNQLASTSRTLRSAKKNIVTVHRDSGRYITQHLKAILKTPRSNKCSGFRVRFRRSPQIRWISPLPSRKRGRRCAE